MDPRSSEDDFRVVVGRVGQDGAFKVRLRGVLDATAEAELAQVLADLATADVVVLDVSELDVLPASGVRMLADRLGDGPGTRLSLEARTDSPAARVLRLLGVPHSELPAEPVVLERLRVVEDGDVGDRQVVRHDPLTGGPGPVFFSYGSLSVVCGECSFTLLHGLPSTAALGAAIVECPQCGALNETWEAYAGRSRRSD